MLPALYERHVCGECAASEPYPEELSLSESAQKQIEERLVFNPPYQKSGQIA